MMDLIIGLIIFSFLLLIFEFGLREIRGI